MSTKRSFSGDTWRKLLFESLLIVFSILLALLINQWREHGKEVAQRKKALGMIIKELEHNALQLRDAMPYHENAVTKMDSILAIPATHSPLNQATTLGITSGLLRQGIKPPELQTTAWNTAQLSGAVSLFDEETIYALANVYETQSRGVEIMWKEIAKFYLDPNSSDPTFTKRNFPLLRFYFNELYHQEIFLEERTTEAIKQLKKEPAL